MLLTVVVLCVVCLTDISAAPTAKTEPPGEKQVKNPYEDSGIPVEAFVVEVSLDTLYKSGVSPIGQKPDSVSIENILYCIKDKKNGKVTAGTSVAVKNKQKGRTENKEKNYIARERQVTIENGKSSKTKIFENYTTGIDFSVIANIRSENKIEVSFSFSQSVIVLSKDDTPPNIIEREWSNTVSLKAGQPGIVGSIQNEDNAVFLILVADIKN